MRTLSLSLTLLWIAVHASSAQIQLVNTVTGAPSVSEIASFSQGDFTYIDIEALAKALEINTYRDDAKGKIVLYLDGGRLKLTGGNHFAVTEREILQLPADVKITEGTFFIPLQPFLELFEDYFPGDFEYLGGRLVYSSRKSNILDLYSTYEGDRGVFDIVTGASLPFSSAREPGGRLILTFPDAAADPDRFREMTIPEGLDSLRALRLRGEVKLILVFEKGIKVDTVFVLTNPHGVRIETSGFASRNSETINHTLQKFRKDWRFDTIVIDPGHGGEDPGAIGRSKLREKEVTLDVSKRLARLLKERMGIKVVLTRDKDVFIPLAERGKIANRAGGKLFVSIHCNACKNRRAHGVETFFLKPARNKNALDVAMRENASVKYEKDQSIYQDLTDENYILLAMAQSNYARESESFAGVIQEQFGSRTSLKNRGVDQAGFYVLYGANMPAVLVELGFISNKNEERLLRTKQFRQKAAEIMFHSVKGFCELKEKEL